MKVAAAIVLRVLILGPLALLYLTLECLSVGVQKLRDQLDGKLPPC